MQGAIRRIAGLEFRVPTPSLWCLFLHNGMISVKCCGTDWTMSVYDTFGERTARRHHLTFEHAIGIILDAVHGARNADAKR